MAKAAREFGGTEAHSEAGLDTRDPAHDSPWSASRFVFASQTSSLRETCGICFVSAGIYLRASLHCSARCVAEVNPRPAGASLHLPSRLLDRAECGCYNATHLIITATPFHG